MTANMSENRNRSYTTTELRASMAEMAESMSDLNSKVTEMRKSLDGLMNCAIREDLRDFDRQMAQLGCALQEAVIIRCYPEIKVNFEKNTISFESFEDENGEFPEELKSTKGFESVHAVTDRDSKFHAIKNKMFQDNRPVLIKLGSIEQTRQNLISCVRKNPKRFNIEFEELDEMFTSFKNIPEFPDLINECEINRAGYFEYFMEQEYNHYSNLLNLC